MQKIEYDLPIFKDGDIADLNEYSEQMAEAIKVQIDKFGNPLIFKGSVNTIEELNTLTIIETGNIYRVIDKNKNYIYNGTSWEEYSDNIDINILELKSHKYTLTTTETTEAGSEIEIPCNYKVGTDALDVYLNGERLILSSDEAGTDGHYVEVGETDSISNKIKITSDWAVEAGMTFEFVVRGGYSNET